MNPIIYAVPVFLISIAVEAVLGWRSGRKIYEVADAVTSLQMGILSQVGGLFTKIFVLGLYSFIFVHLSWWHWSLNNMSLWLIALILYDLCYYWNHRINHEVGIFWASHVVHHSSEYYNLTTALRQSSTGAFLGWIFYLPMAVIGVPPAMFVGVALIDLLYQYWVHTELIGKLGWFDRVFVSPSNHRVHHGQNDYCIDKNYGGILIVWDRLFGSFAEERDNEEICFGVRKPLHSYNPVWGNLHYYVDLAMASRRARGIRAKISAWFAPPGGWRHGPIDHFEPTLFVRYSTLASSHAKWIGVIGYLILMALALNFLVIFDGMKTLNATVYALGIALGAMLLGQLLMSTPRTPQPEHH